MATVRYFAAARAAAGVAEEAVPADTLESCLALISERHGPDLARVLVACSFLVDGLASTSRTGTLASQCIIDVLPPFAGG